MQSKSFLMAVAAFAVTTTGVHAYGGSKILNKAGISEEQIVAFEEARELRRSGDIEAARDRLIEAGIDEGTLKKVHHARKHHKFLEDLTDEQRDAFRVAKQANDRATMQAIIDEAGIVHTHKFNKQH